MVSVSDLAVEIAKAKQEVTDQMNTQHAQNMAIEIQKVKDEMGTKFKEIMVEEIRKVKVEFEENAAKEKKLKTKKPNLTMKKSFLKLPTYAGKFDEHDDWKFKWTTFLSDEHHILAVLKEVDTSTGSPRPTSSKPSVYFV